MCCRRGRAAAADFGIRFNPHDVGLVQGVSEEGSSADCRLLREVFDAGSGHFQIGQEWLRALAGCWMRRLASLPESFGNKDIRARYRVRESGGDRRSSGVGHLQAPSSANWHVRMITAPAYAAMSADAPLEKTTDERRALDPPDILIEIKGVHPERRSIRSPIRHDCEQRYRP